jgi:S-adenosylmethionine:tRNA ribosyltransferase-isomerase
MNVCLDNVTKGGFSLKSLDLSITPLGNASGTMSNIPEDFSLEAYDYHLPRDRIAMHPAGERDRSRLLVLDRSSGQITDTSFQELVSCLPEGSLLVKNVSRVFPARLRGVKDPSGGRVEFLLLTPLPLISPLNGGQGWKRAQVQGLLKPMRGIRSGQQVKVCEELQLTVLDRQEFGQVRVDMAWKGELLPLINSVGLMPLPPYIKREAEEQDQDRYQTVYGHAGKTGSVAAPTAGLHFTPKVMESLRKKAIHIADVTLYVGYGTFSPIRVQDIRTHQMHPEYIELGHSSAQAIHSAKQEGRAVVAVGTTTVRALESIVQQCGRIEAFQGWSDLYIRPGYVFQVIDHLITNFHLPKSSLMVMVSAFCGREELLRAYRHALESGYRFFSYGDAMLIL